MDPEPTRRLEEVAGQCGAAAVPQGSGVWTSQVRCTGPESDLPASEPPTLTRAQTPLLGLLKSVPVAPLTDSTLSITGIHKNDFLYVIEGPYKRLQKHRQ